MAGIGPALVSKAVSPTTSMSRKAAERIAKGKFDLQDLCDQLAQMEKIGGIGGIMGLLPGVAKMKDQIAKANLDDGMIKRQRAIILSMTPKERRNPDLLKASRKKRIAAGSGTTVPDINRLLKQYMEMSRMMKQVSKLGQKGLMRTGISNLFRR
mgnify:CR=1 FL=1